MACDVKPRATASSGNAIKRAYQHCMKRVRGSETARQRGSEAATRQRGSEAARQRGSEAAVYEKRFEFINELVK